MALLEQGLGRQHGWLTQPQLLDAGAIGQFTPGPVLSTATFIGYILGGIPGAAVAAVGIFLPSFFYVAPLAPALFRLRQSAWMAAFLDSVHACAVALTAAITLRLGVEALPTWGAGAIALAALAVLLRWKISPAGIVLGGGIAGVAGCHPMMMVPCQFDFKFTLLRTCMKLPNMAGAMLGIVLLASAHAADRKYIVNPRPADAKSLPFSDGVLVGDTLYIAGHIGLDPKSGQAPADPEQEARLAMDGIKTTVEAAGLSMDDVVSVEIFCTDLKLYETFNAVYKTYFQGQYPARAFIGTDKLLRGGRYEVMGIAIKKAK